MASQTEQEKAGTQLDEKDYEILRLLERNAKLTVREIAVKINLSPTPTHERIKRLEKAGVIKSYTAILDKRMLNKRIMVICMVTLREHSRKAGADFINAVLEFDEVIECYNISGDFDFMLKIVSESMDSYHSFFVNKLSEVKGIGHSKSTFVMDIIKETNYLL